MDLPLAFSPGTNAAMALLLTGVVAPIVGLLLRQGWSGWDSIGGGPFAIEHEQPKWGRGRPAAAVDPAIQAAEVRQMLAAKSARLERRGEAPIDVEVETTRLLAPPADSSSPGDRMDAALRAEVRQLVIARNERRRRQGLEPLEVEAETERQLNRIA